MSNRKKTAKGDRKTTVADDRKMTAMEDSKASATAETRLKSSATEITPEMAKAICEHDHSILIAQQQAFLDAFQRYEYSLKKLSAVLEKDLQKYPEGFLRIDAKGAATDFYYYKDKERGTGRYLPYHSNEKLIHDLCQKRYSQKLLTQVNRTLRLLHRCSLQTLSADLKAVYNKLSSSRKLLVSPHILPDDQYVYYWKLSHQADRSFYEESSIYDTQNNERVRSKSEVIIANMLSSFGVPYVYEPVLSLGQSEFRPDFIVLNVRTRTEYYWEHLGLLDDENYVKNAFRKIAVYENNGIIPGVNLILSFESTSVPFDIQLLKNLIKHFCL